MERQLCCRPPVLLITAAVDTEGGGGGIRSWLRAQPLRLPADGVRGDSRLEPVVHALASATI